MNFKNFLHSLDSGVDFESVTGSVRPAAPRPGYPPAEAARIQILVRLAECLVLWCWPVEGREIQWSLFVSAGRL